MDDMMLFLSLLLAGEAKSTTIVGRLIEIFKKQHQFEINDVDANNIRVDSPTPTHFLNSEKVQDYVKENFNERCAPVINRQYENSSGLGKVDISCRLGGDSFTFYIS